MHNVLNGQTHFKNLAWPFSDIMHERVQQIFSEGYENSFWVPLGLFSPRSEKKEAPTKWNIQQLLVFKQIIRKL